jgi:hypothetical protein
MNERLTIESFAKFSNNTEFLTKYPMGIEHKDIVTKETIMIHLGKNIKHWIAFGHTDKVIKEKILDYLSNFRPITVELIKQTTEYLDKLKDNQNE